MNKYDKGLDRALTDLGIKRPGHIMLTQDASRDLGASCMVCRSRLVVYTTTAPLGDLFPSGSYCYNHLVKQCRLASCIPFPIDQGLLDQVKTSLGLPISQAAALSFRVKNQRG